MHGLKKLLQLPAWVLLAVAAGMTATIGLIDYVTGPEMGTAIFHLLPIYLICRRGCYSGALLICVLAAAVWLLVDLTDAERYSRPWLPYWNASVRLLFFLIVALLLFRLREQKIIARQDALTEVANRRAFWEAAEKEIERCRRYKHPMSVAYLDLDNFKSINDRLGHRGGDKILRKFAALLQRSVRSTDTVARIGGDEFAVLLPETEAIGAEAALDHVSFEIANDFNEFRLGCSIGIVTCLTPPESVDSLIHQADAMMLGVKRNGKNRSKHQILDERHAAAL